MSFLEGNLGTNLNSRIGEDLGFGTGNGAVEGAGRCIDTLCVSAYVL